MTINMTTFTYPVELSVTEQPIKLTISNLMYQAQGSGTGDAVNSVNGHTGDVVLTASDVGAEKVGIAASLVSGVTTTSIGAATTAQGTKADTALQSADVAPVALSGSYNDLSNKPTIPMLPTLATVATSGSYTDLTNKPDLTLKQDKLPTTGTAGQFLAHDLTFKTPAGGGGGNSSVLGITTGFNVIASRKDAYFDNSILDVDYTISTVPINSDITVPVVFASDVTVSEFGLYGTASDSTSSVTLHIYDASVTGLPNNKLISSLGLTVLNGVSAYRARSFSFTFLKNTVYWLRFQNTSPLNIQCLNRLATMTFGTATYVGVTNPDALRANSIAAHNLSVSNTFRFAGDKSYAVHGDSALTRYGMVNNVIPRIIFKAA